jgi:hypothetical protein
VSGIALCLIICHKQQQNKIDVWFAIAAYLCAALHERPASFKKTGVSFEQNYSSPSLARFAALPSSALSESPLAPDTEKLRPLSESSSLSLFSDPVPKS